MSDRYDGHRNSPTGVMLDDEIERRRQEIRHIIAMTPLAAVPIKGKSKRGRRPGVRRQTMKYAHRKMTS